MAATATLAKPKRGRPGRAVLPCAPARNKDLAARNRKITGAVTRKRKPLTQAEAAEHFGVDQPTVSIVVRNPCSGKVKGS